MVEPVNPDTNAHLLTFGCYHHFRLFSEPGIPDLFCSHLQQQRKISGLKLWAFVIMPNHVHLLILPPADQALKPVINRIKQQVAFKAIQEFRLHRPGMIERLTEAKSGGNRTRFWQVGGGHDRILKGPEALYNMITYIHHNPVRANLVMEATDFRWSSALFWELGKPDPLRMDIPEWWAERKSDDSGVSAR
ncbi:transposase [bacterium]|nr:transposase [bacterium]